MPYGHLLREGRICKHRVKRDTADYVGAGSISETEAEDLLEEARAFTQAARAWIEANHPDFAGWRRMR